MILRWMEDGLYYAQTEELDLIASSEDPGELPTKLGDMVIDLLVFLIEEVPEDERTEAERQTLARLLLGFRGHLCYTPDGWTPRPLLQASSRSGDPRS